MCKDRLNSLKVWLCESYDYVLNEHVMWLCGWKGDLYKSIIEYDIVASMSRRWWRSRVMPKWLLNPMCCKHESEDECLELIEVGSMCNPCEWWIWILVLTGYHRDVFVNYKHDVHSFWYIHLFTKLWLTLEYGMFCGCVANHSGNRNYGEKNKWDRGSPRGLNMFGCNSYVLES